MKKFYKSWLLLPLFTLLLFLTSCSQKPEISAKKAGELFVEELIYHKRTDDFKENFKDSDQLITLMEKSSDDFTNSLEGSLVSAKVDQGTADVLAQLLQHAVEEKTTYTLDVSKETKENAELVYHIKGLNYSQLIETTTTSLFTALKADPQLVKDEGKIRTLVIDTLKKEIPKMALVEKEQTIPLNLKIEEKKWVVDEKAQKAISELYLTFFTGEKNNEDLQQKVEAVLKKANDELATKVVK